MVVLNATCRNGIIELEAPLPIEFEGKQVQVMLEEIKTEPRKRRQAGSAEGQIWIAPDFEDSILDF